MFLWERLLAAIEGAYFLRQNLRQGSRLPSMIYGYAGGRTLSQKTGVRGAIKAKLEDDGLFLEFLD